MPITIAFYGALLGLVFIYLSVATLRRRKAVQAAIGDGGDVLLRKKVRAHGNFQEYVPISLILLGYFEVLGANPWLLHFSGAALLLGRISHAYGVSQRKENLIFRVVGMSLTFVALLIACLGILFTLFVKGA